MIARKLTDKDIVDMTINVGEEIVQREHSGEGRSEASEYAINKYRVGTEVPKKVGVLIDPGTEG
jgi:hypothetical protein